ncbi:hypothetical protein Pelo_971 [Pelomyxa schiedti]|nr:hypothetical protein Pelo_971 [Pelomyxa schiedti]
MRRVRKYTVGAFGVMDMEFPRDFDEAFRKGKLNVEHMRRKYYKHKKNQISTEQARVLVHGAKPDLIHAVFIGDCEPPKALSSISPTTHHEESSAETTSSNSNDSDSQEGDETEAPEESTTSSTNSTRPPIIAATPNPSYSTTASFDDDETQWPGPDADETEITPAAPEPKRPKLSRPAHLVHNEE